MSKKKSKSIKWTNVERKIGDLVPYEFNPREIMAIEAQRLSESLDAFGQAEQLIIGPNDELYNGHQRQKV